MTNGADVAEVALKELNQKQGANKPTKSTLLIHSVQRPGKAAGTNGLHDSTTEMVADSNTSSLADTSITSRDSESPSSQHVSFRDQVQTMSLENVSRGRSR